MAQHTKECMAAAMHKAIDGWLAAPASLVNARVFQRCLEDGSMFQAVMEEMEIGEKGEVQCLCPGKEQ